MNDPAPSADRQAPLRRSAYALFVAVGAALVLARLASVSTPDGRSPLLSANDRSRWSTVRALGDHGHYELDPVIVRRPDARDPRARFDRAWSSIDLVRRRAPNGHEYYYSSKPPLLATLVAGPYWLLKQAAGAGLGEQPFYYVRGLLLLVNVLPLAGGWLLLLRLIERHGRTNFGRLLAAAAAVFGTCLTTFAVTLNNHLPAALAVLVAVWAALPLWSGEKDSWRRYALAGLAAAFAAANELPALSFCIALGAGLAWRSPLRTLLAYLPAAGLVAAAFFGTNYAAVQSWRPPYAHRSDGPVLGVLTAADGEALLRGAAPDELRARAAKLVGAELSPALVAEPTAQADRWSLWDPEGADRFVLLRGEEGYTLRAWDNWYEYDGSYWSSGNKQGVDRGEPSRLAYAFHVLLGHHGVFSLTPLWLLSAAGMAWWARSPRKAEQGLAVLTILVSLACLAFYLSRPLEDRNYGGVSCCLRWLLWLAPLWLLCLLPAADALAGRPGGRGLAVGLLAASVFSANYAAANPWSHPWLYDYWVYLRWVTP